MDKIASWLSNHITPEAALYEFEEILLPKIQDTKKLFERRQIDSTELHQDIEDFYKNINLSAQKLIKIWDKKLQLEESFTY